MWVFHHKDSGVFVAKSTRAQTVIGEFLGDFSPDYWPSDRYSGQLGWAEKENQQSGVDLARFQPVQAKEARRIARFAYCWLRAFCGTQESPNSRARRGF